MFPIEDEANFVVCFRSLIACFRLSPERSAAQLAAILRRVSAVLDGRKTEGMEEAPPNYPDRRTEP